MSEMQTGEARSRLLSIFDVCEHERRGLEALEDARLDEVLHAMEMLEAQLESALQVFGAPGETAGPAVP